MKNVSTIAVGMVRGVLYRRAGGYLPPWWFVRVVR